MPTTVIRMSQALHLAPTVGLFYVGRAVSRLGIPGSPWANPYTIGEHRDGTRTDCLRLFLLYAREHPDGQDLCRRAHLLKDHQLACWCCERGQVLTLDDPIVCHAQLWGWIAEGRDLRELPEEIQPPSALLCSRGKGLTTWDLKLVDELAQQLKARAKETPCP